jgi:hypothetical protein
MSLADSLARQTRLLGSTSLHPSVSEVPMGNWRELCREFIHFIIWLDSHLDRVLNSGFGGHEFLSPVWWELCALPKMDRSLGSGLSTQHQF